jgi:hypothetical protein
VDFDPTTLLLSLIPGGIGFVLLTYGKKAGRWPHAVAGLLFLAYPYFTSSGALLRRPAGLVNGPPEGGPYDGSPPEGGPYDGSPPEGGPHPTA